MGGNLGNQGSDCNHAVYPDLPNLVSVLVVDSDYISCYLWSWLGYDLIVIKSTRYFINLILKSLWHKALFLQYLTLYDHLYSFLRLLSLKFLNHLTNVCFISLSNDSAHTFLLQQWGSCNDTIMTSHCSAWFVACIILSRYRTSYWASGSLLILVLIDWFLVGKIFEYSLHVGCKLVGYRRLVLVKAVRLLLLLDGYPWYVLGTPCLFLYVSLLCQVQF